MQLIDQYEPHKSWGLRHCGAVYKRGNENNIKKACLDDKRVFKILDVYLNNDTPSGFAPDRDIKEDFWEHDVRSLR